MGWVLSRVGGDVVLERETDGLRATVLSDGPNRYRARCAWTDPSDAPEPAVVEEWRRILTEHAGQRLEVMAERWAFGWLSVSFAEVEGERREVQARP